NPSKHYFIVNITAAGKNFHIVLKAVRAPGYGNFMIAHLLMIESRDVSIILEEFDEGEKHKCVVFSSLCIREVKKT
ncbi:hypothetical protein ACJX0J_038725, partial [Zea mays]